MNTRRMLSLVMVALLFLVWAPSALAAGTEGGGVHFGPYTLAAGESVSGDLLVIGPVVIESDATFDGDLSVFGPFTMEEGALLDGDLSVFGDATIAGTVTGDCAIAGPVVLRSTAVIEGDLAVAGKSLVQEDGATVYGDIEEESGDGVSVDVPYAGTFEVDAHEGRGGFALRLLWTLMKSGLLLVVALLFTVMIVTLWPKEVETIGETIAAAPPITFAIGLAVLIAAALVILLLTLTVCLIPLAFVVAVAVGVGVAVGWVALGALIGRKLLDLVQLKKRPSPVVEALIGTFFITSMAVLINIVSDCLVVILVWPLAALGTGAVLLTRFGTTPYLGGPIFTSAEEGESLPVPSSES